MVSLTLIPTLLRALVIIVVLILILLPAFVLLELAVPVAQIQTPPMLMHNQALLLVAQVLEEEDMEIHLGQPLMEAMALMVDLEFMFQLLL